MRKLIILAVIFGILLIFNPAALINAESMKSGELLIELNSDKGLEMDKIIKKLKNNILVVNEFRGTVEINSEVITFGFYGEYRLIELDDQIQNQIKKLQQNYLDNEVDIYEINKTLKSKIVVFKGTKSTIADVEKELSNEKIKELKIVDPQERANWIKNSRDSNSSVSKFGSNKSGISKKLLNRKFRAPQSDLLSLGGASYNNGQCDTSSINPNCGDGQDRLKQKKRFNSVGSTYNWLPNYISSSVTQVNSGTLERKIVAAFTWSSNNLANLNNDSNETIEAEVKFYNFGSGVGIPGDGRAYMYSFPPTSWSTNLPNGYLDTRFSDLSTEPSYAIGTATPNQIVAGNTYSFIINAFPEAYVTTGLWQLSFQRGYWLDNTNLAYRLIRGTGPEWYVFNEEYETTAKVKQYHKYDTSGYAPSSFNHTTETTHASQFRYAEIYTEVSKGSLIATGSIESQNYKVYRLTVDTPGVHTISTSQNGTAADTYISLYNHSFTEIASNDDFSGLYSRISMNLSKGNYYVIVRGYNWNSLSNCNLVVN